MIKTVADKQILRHYRPMCVQHICKTFCPGYRIHAACIRYRHLYKSVIFHVKTPENTCPSLPSHYTPVVWRSLTVHSMRIYFVHKPCTTYVVCTTQVGWFLIDFTNIKYKVFGQTFFVKYSLPWLFRGNKTVHISVIIDNACVSASKWERNTEKKIVTMTINSVDNW